jgi:predicted transcriptional regulator
MGYQLWISPQTGIRRKGTTFKELQTLFIDQITTKFIFEPIYSCNINDNGLIVKEQLEIKDFDIVGVLDDNKNIIGYAKKEELKDGLIIDSIRNFDLDLIITDSTPISYLPSLLIHTGFVFVTSINKIVGIVTIADLNKPVFRIYLFGIISLFEMHLNYWINNYYSDNSWSPTLTEQRLNKAKEFYKERVVKNLGLSLLECLQFCDKRDILKNTSEFNSVFNFSESEFEEFLKTVEKIRNELAHSQSSIISNLEWNTFTETISCIEKFLSESEQIIEDEIKTKGIN